MATRNIRQRQRAEAARWGAGEEGGGGAGCKQAAKNGCTLCAREEHRTHSELPPKERRGREGEEGSFCLQHAHAKTYTTITIQYASRLEARLQRVSRARVKTDPPPLCLLVHLPSLAHNPHGRFQRGVQNKHWIHRSNIQRNGASIAEG